MSGYETTAFNRNRINVNKDMRTNYPLDGLITNKTGILMGFSKPTHQIILNHIRLPKEMFSAFAYLEVESESKDISLGRNFRIKSPIIK